MEAIATKAHDPLADIRRRLEPQAMRASALAELDEVFRAGSVPDPRPRGFQSGTLVTTAIAGGVDAAARRLTHLYMPWLGKSFEPERERGINVLKRSARSQLKILWPSYDPREDNGTLQAFAFQTRVDRGAVDPDIDVLKIDYDFEANPSFLIRRILDELVQIDDGFYLGKILFRTSSKWRPIGFFSLQSA